MRDTTIILSRKMTFPKQVVLAYVKKINEHDPEGLARLMTQDHIFIDSLGRTFNGRGVMKKGWEEYFKLFSDYTIKVTDFFENRGTIVILGTASGIHLDKGSMKQTKWTIPAAWKAVVTDGLVSEWHVYADNFETMKLLSGN